MSLAPFSPAVRDWFAASFDAPTAAQSRGWKAIANGDHTLVLAPTGSGKTLAAFMWAIDRLASEPPPLDTKARTRVIYISPLRALAVDIEKNLRAPLAGIRHSAERATAPLAHEPVVGVRTGDTPARERRQLLTHPPDILITTPESLYLMLTSSARETLRGVTTVIVDEIHALAGTKRGAHLALSLERLEALTDDPPQRIGLSATQRPLETIARFLGGHADDGAPRPVTIVDAGRRKPMELVAIHQHPALFPDLAVAENLALGVEPAGAFARVDWPARRARAREALARVGADIDVNREARSLSLPEQQLVEMARALSVRARLLILDEPTASLTPREVDRLFELLADLRATGVAIVYISHRLDELPRLADRVTVLRDGRTVATEAMAEVDAAALIRLMVGREVASVFPKRKVAVGEPVLEVEHLSSAEAGARDITLTVGRGEIVGLAGLVGAGRTELARVLFGLTPRDAGSVRVAGREVRPRSPEQAIAAGIAYLPEDRRRHGVVLDLPVASNLTLASLALVSRHGLLDRAAERATAARLVDALSVKTASLDTPVRRLSGGNQQKVALGRWLARTPDVLILDEPTQGVDVGAKAEIHRLIGDLAAQGMGVLLISSELLEVMGMSDRILVMRHGQLVAEFARATADAESVMAAAFGRVPAA